MKNKDIVQIVNKSNIMFAEVIRLHSAAVFEDGIFTGKKLDKRTKKGRAYAKAKKEYEEWLEQEVKL